MLKLENYEARYILSKAAKSNDQELVKNLINKGIDINLYALLPHFIAKKNENWIDFLLQNGANTNLPYAFANTALTTAIETDQLGLAKKLIENYNADINQLIKGKSALICACKKNR